MTRNRMNLFIVAALLVIGVVGYSFSSITLNNSAQSLANDNSSIIRELLSEVRQLRLTLQQSALSTNLSQITIERLRMQNELVNVLQQELNQCREEQANNKVSRARSLERLKDLENQLSIERDEIRRSQLEGESKDLRYLLDNFSQQEERQRERESVLDAQLRSEQEKRSALNSRLDKIEKNSSTPRP